MTKAMTFDRDAYDALMFKVKDRIELRDMSLKQAKTELRIARRLRTLMCELVPESDCAYLQACRKEYEQSILTIRTLRIHALRYSQSAARYFDRASNIIG